MSHGLRIICLALLLWMNIEILVRRWHFRQLPTQIPDWLVYVVIAVNFVVITWLGKVYLESTVAEFFAQRRKNSK